MVALNVVVMRSLRDKGTVVAVISVVPLSVTTYVETRECRSKWDAEEEALLLSSVKWNETFGRTFIRARASRRWLE